jgi:hypothetical protein
MFKLSKISSKIIPASSSKLPNIKYVVYDLLIEKNSLGKVIPYFEKNNVLFDEQKGNLKFRIAALTQASAKAFNKIDASLDNKNKIQVALAFDKKVTDRKLFGIGYEKDAMTSTGTKIRYLIRDELLALSGLNKYLSVDKNG